MDVLDSINKDSNVTEKISDKPLLAALNAKGKNILKFSLVAASLVTLLCLISKFNLKVKRLDLL